MSVFVIVIQALYNPSSEFVHDFPTSQLEIIVARAASAVCISRILPPSPHQRSCGRRLREFVSHIAIWKFPAAIPISAGKIGRVSLCCASGAYMEFAIIAVPFILAALTPLLATAISAKWISRVGFDIPLWLGHYHAARHPTMVLLRSVTWVQHFGLSELYLDGSAIFTLRLQASARRFSSTPATMAGMRAPFPCAAQCYGQHARCRALETCSSCSFAGN